MRLPGTRYQEPGWEEVRKLLGQCSLAALRAAAPAGDGDDALAAYVERMGALLHAQRHGARARAAGNGYGESVFELALGLVYELGARPSDWQALRAAVDGETRTPGAAGAHVDDALLRKKVNDMYAQLRDKVDADNYQVACGRPCSANRMYAYRMLDTAYGEIARLFGNWTQHRAQVGAILGRPVDDGAQATPIEVRQLRSIADCRPEWVLRWSETRERFGAGLGPLHTRSKRFASLKTSPDKIAAMLREIGEYEALSANRDVDFARDLDDASVWIEDYWRVLQASEDAAVDGPDLILEARQDELDAAAVDEQDEAPAGVSMPVPVQAPLPEDPRQEAAAVAVSLPPGYLRMAAEAETAQAPAPHGGWIAGVFADDGLPVRLAVYARLLGPGDDSYPDAWRDPASGDLPTMQQLAGLAGVSLPTLRKRRDAAIERLLAQGQTRMRAPHTATTRRDR